MCRTKLGVGRKRVEALKKELEKVSVVLEKYESVDKSAMVSKQEFKRRQKAIFEALRSRGLQVGFVFSDEHYCGDVPYLGGNTNVSIEQVAGVIGESGFHIIAGLEGGYVAEQLAKRSDSKVHKVQMLQLADEKYPIRAEKLEDVLREANGGRDVRSLGLLTPRRVVPSAIVEYLNRLLGPRNVVDAQELYYKVKYLKSDEEMKLIEDASKIANAMMRGMLAILKPGLLETQVAAWGYFIAKELGSEENGWDIIVGANEANRTLIGKALNREIRRGDFVHLGVAPKRDGLNSCVRRSVIAVEDPNDISEEQRYWFNFIEEAFEVGYKEYCRVAREGLPARVQEEALMKYFRSKTDEVNRKFKLNIADLSNLKPYTGTHNAGYTECQEFYGAITEESNEPLGEQIVTMLDVALRGIGDRWDDVIIPGLDYIVIEDTLGKFGKIVRDFNEKLPRNVQHMVGNVSELL
ncbi:MAG: M24 family metallopeptidase [Thermoproteota archaeon]